MQDASSLEPQKSSNGVSIPPREEPQVLSPAPEKRVTTKVTQTIVSEQFAGPVPHPSILKGYEEICPGAANRILAMAESDQAFSHMITEKALDAEREDTSRGQKLAAVVSVAALAASVALAAFGAPVAAAVVGGTTVVALATAFILGRKAPSPSKQEPKPKSGSPSGNGERRPDSPKPDNAKKKRSRNRA